MPTGVHIQDARRQLLAAVERVLVREGPHALTSRTITEEAGFSKGVLHRHFADVDALLTAFVLDQVERVEQRAVALREHAGTGDIADHVASSLIEMFSTAGVAIIPLIIFRDELRSRLRAARPTARGVPILTDVTTMISTYLAAERVLGRLAPDADTDSLALSLVGGAHLLLTDRGTSEPADVCTMVAAIIADASSN